MELSQENRYVVECFRENFILKNRGRVVIYGIGINTRAILETVRPECVIGLMDSACEGGKLMGLPVYSIEETLQCGDCVVIVARNSVVPIIFERIRILEDQWHFPIYNIQGERLSEKRDVQFINNNEYWEKDVDSLVENIKKYDVISFDIFDTLIIRKCMLPTDVFFMEEVELGEKGIYADGFAVIRRETELQLANGCPTLKEIYKSIAQKLEWSVQECEIAYKSEIEIEKRVCVPRESVCAIYQQALTMGKRIILISDMYLPASEMRLLLAQCGIWGYERLFISCEEKAEKKDGKLYKKVQQMGYENFFHIGDNELSDGSEAKKCCIENFIIWSPYEMLVQSSLRKILVNADTLEKRICIGHIQRVLFDDPFCLGHEKGMVVIRRKDILGYVFLAPIVSCFLFFLLDELKRKEIDKILFCARDGYVIWKLYRKFVEKNNVEELPEGEYFKTSRRAITVPTIRGEEDISLILQKPYNTTMGELLFARFGIKHKEDDLNASKKAISTENGKEVNSYILGYKETIISNAAEEKKAYLKYIEQNAITKGKKIAIYDFCSGGTIQYYFNKLTEKEVRGIYFATVNYPNVFFSDSSKASTLFGNIGQYEIKYHLAAHYMYMEAVLTDENGTLLKFDKNGIPVYDVKENSRRNFKAIEEIQAGIFQYFDELLEERKRLNYDEMKTFADMLFGCLFQPEVCEVSEELRDIVKAESTYDFMKTYTAWSRE